MGAPKEFQNGQNKRPLITAIAGGDKVRRKASHSLGDLDRVGER
jgi:hypothetical protein